MWIPKFPIVQARFLPTASRHFPHFEDVWYIGAVACALPLSYILVDFVNSGRAVCNGRTHAHHNLYSLFK